ncbi:epoxide hydrolase family protein [Sphingopyxis sp.]|uniref:epoxide hydrolase family protein n=1 Tax=Sphingopyxis sp. TaxID=1908224 RepID=UPI003D6D1F6C
MTIRLDRLERFDIHTPQSSLDEMQARLARYRPPTEPVDAGWRYGVDGTWLKSLIAYWQDGFDWRAAEARLNQWPHYRARLDVGGREIAVHLIVQHAARADAPVVLLTPGWPSSLIEYHELIGRLSMPERYGGRATDAVHVVAAELPGFGLSEAPAAPMTHRAMAGLWRTLMVDILEVPRFFMHGGDWGSVTGSWLAFDHPDCVRGLHLSMLGLRPAIDREAAPLGEAEIGWLTATKKRLDADGGYRELQATKPTTLAVALSDSPAALAAWLIEKYHGWSGQEVDEDPAIDRDQLLTAATLYWTLGNLPTANWIYWADRNLGNFGLAKGERIEIPTGFSMHGGGFFPIAPRCWAERAYNVVQWDEHPAGGHFAAWLMPEPVAASLFRFISACR